MSKLLRDDIYASLRGDILSCRLAPGSELREQVLAAHFGVSKSPVREALLRLERDRLVEVEARQGYCVTPISLKDTRDMYMFRMVLESSCALEAAHNATAEKLAALDEFREPKSYGAALAFSRRNCDFHSAIFEASGNLRMALVARELVEQMDRVTVLSIGTMPAKDPSRLVDEHCRIIDALQKRDGRRAAKLLREHVGEAAKRALKALAKSAVRA